MHGQTVCRTLYVDPLRGSAVALFLIALGGGLFFIPFLPVVQGGLVFDVTFLASAALFMPFGALVAFPGFQYIRLIARSEPLVTTDGETVRRERLGVGTTRIAWDHVGSLSFRSLWVILMDGRVEQNRFTRFMFGTKGVWIPALFVRGGGEETMRFIRDHRPKLIDEALKRASLGRGGL